MDISYICFFLFQNETLSANKRNTPYNSAMKKIQSAVNAHTFPVLTVFIIQHRNYRI